MVAVLFEVTMPESAKPQYLELASALKSLLEKADGFVSVERFQSLVQGDKILSLSFWRDEAAASAWRNDMQHRAAQKTARAELFSGYRLRVCSVLRDYGKDEREGAPADSNALFGE